MANNQGKGGGEFLYCSFCHKSQHEVRKLIAGSGVHFCNSFWMMFSTSSPT